MTYLAIACLASFGLGCLLCGLACLTHSADLDEAEREEAGRNHLYRD